MGAPSNVTVLMALSLIQFVEDVDVVEDEDVVEMEEEMAMVTKMERTMKKKEIMKAVDVVVEAVELEDSNLMNWEKMDISKQSTFQFEKFWYLKIKSKHLKPWLG